ncbi:UNVERIFIED_CONTAM: DNA-binding response OmpR family regulator [Brevibacillus sp. OAP136]
MKTEERKWFMLTTAQILLVEDDPEIARIVRDHLRREGYGVTWSTTGMEGWADFQTDSFDLVIVDLMLPEMDGFTLCKNIRLISEVPLLIMSAKHEDESKVRGLELGADDYLTKPFSLTELSARISSHLRRFRRYQNKPDNGKRSEYKQGLTIDFEVRVAYVNGSRSEARGNAEIGGRNEVDFLEIETRYK